MQNKTSRSFKAQAHQKRRERHERKRRELRAERRAFRRTKNNFERENQIHLPLLFQKLFQTPGYRKRNTKPAETSDKEN